MQKTVIKFLLIFIGLTLLLCFVFIWFPTLILVWLTFAAIFFVLYYYNKQAYRYYITDKSVRIAKSWIFGTYVREITFDQIRDIHIMQGMIARAFNCGSLAFVTSTGLEVGYAGGGVGVGGGILIGGGGATPVMVAGRGNMFWDIAEPEKPREILMSKLIEWREVFQQQKMAVSLEKIAEKSRSENSTIADDLEKLKKLLDSGAITKEEYEKAKKKLLA